MKEVWEEQVNSVSKTLDNTQQFIKWNQPLRGEVKHIIKTNLHLKSKKQKTEGPSQIPPREIRINP